MYSFTLADVNRYWLRTNVVATRYHYYRESLSKLEARLDTYREKYFTIFSAKAADKLPLVLVVPAHLAIGLVEGLMVVSLFKELIRGSVPGGWPLTLAASMIILVFWGWSLVIGHCFHKANIHGHDLEPRVTYSFGPLVFGLLLGIGYLVFLYKLVEAGKEMAPGNEAKIQIIFFLGMLEAILSYFSILGAQIVWINSSSRILKMRIRYCDWQIRKNAEDCEKNYRFYEHE